MEQGIICIGNVQLQDCELLAAPHSDKKMNSNLKMFQLYNINVML